MSALDAGGLDSLDALAERAQSADADAVAPGAPGQAGALPSAPVDPAREWIDAALNFGQMLRQMHPLTAREWTDERLQAFGAALGKCAGHYGWTLGKLLSHPLAGVFVAAMPLAWPIAQPFVMQWIATQRAKIAPAKGAPAANDANAGAAQ